MLRVVPLLLAAVLFAACASDSPDSAKLSEQEKLHIARLIFHNECSGRTECLTSWNRGEEFASLGMGHFIWYPAGTSAKDKYFSESFPELVHAMHIRGIEPPAWLHAERGCPWPDRAAFLKARDGDWLSELKQWLADHMSEQADFMSERLIRALPRMLAATPKAERAHIRQQFERVAHAPMGMYVLIDYVNFKGEGINPGERYDGQGWGLMQVLSRMQGQSGGMDSIREFSQAAEGLLAERVRHAPAIRHEARWLPGWQHRLATYVREAESYYDVGS